MIEVEKKFQPTAEQLEALLVGAEFLGEEILNDMYYDYADYRLFKKNIHLRNRNGNFELKIGKSSGVAEEIIIEEEIKKYFNIQQDLKKFSEINLILIMNIQSKRKKYRKGEFIIDIDQIDFGYYLVEIELLVNDESEVSEARDKIINLAQSYNFEIKDIPSKRKEYFKIVKPEVYKELYN